VSQFTLIARTIGCRTFEPAKIGGMISETRLGVQWSGEARRLIPDTRASHLAVGPASVKEFAEIVGISEATVKTRMFYARKKLTELVETA
jgi:hypothetical protein